MGTRYMDADSLGRHHYGFAIRERNGIVYTCRGGHIDITHLRKVSDWTAFLAYHIRQAMLKDHTQLSFKLLEPSRYHVLIRYPSGWKDLPLEKKRQIVEDASVTLGQYLAYTGSVWHEVLTWHGFKGAGVYPEYHSAFSWEDNYSNCMGGYIADRALRDPDHGFEEAMTLCLNREIRKLGPRSKGVARDAGEAVRNEWFTGSLIFCTMLKRHMDIGVDDGWITPWLIPAASGCETTEPILYPVPSLNSLRRQGFYIDVEIDPRVWEKDEILRIIYSDPENSNGRIAPEKHFGPIIEHIRVVANQRYGPRADVYELPAALAAHMQTAKAVGPSDVLAQPVVFSPASDDTPADKPRKPTDFKSMPGDVNGDCKVDARDIATLATRWLADDAPQ